MSCVCCVCLQGLDTDMRKTADYISVYLFLKLLQAAIRILIKKIKFAMYNVEHAGDC